MISPFRAAMLLWLCCHCATTSQAAWWRGNLHTHTLWSDGDDYPEMVAEWYRTNGYHFLAISDHNVMLQGEKWIEVKTNRVSQLAFSKYQARFGSKVRTREVNGKKQVRLATLDEIKPLFEKRGQFLMIPSEEISASFEKLPIHINATNLRDEIKPLDGVSVYDVMQKNIDAILAQRERTGQAMIPHLNHPNFHYAVSAEDLMQVRGERFFEVYNGHPYVYNEGDATHPSTERIWDIVLAWRLAVLKLEPLFGIAVDDSHNYHEFQPKNSNSGRGWIMVGSPKLEAESLIHAMEAGDFYASTGVRLKNVERKSGRLRLQIATEPGVTYRTRFIGTPRSFLTGYDAQKVPQTDPTRIGTVVSEVEGASAEYKLKKDDMYVRAVVQSSKPKANGVTTNEVERAWTQPVIASDLQFGN